jgi:hypothetical protein
MSQSKSITVACPACKNKQRFTVWHFINATRNPELKQQLLDRSLVTFECEKCGRTAGIEQELMYHDMDRKLMILRGEDEPEDTLAEAFGPVAATVQAEYTYRLVGSVNELIEKILIWDAGFDDRVMEIVKLLLMGHIDASQRGEDAELFFAGRYAEANSEEMIEFILLNESGSTSWAVPQEQTVEKCEAQLRGILPDRKSERGQWLRIDRQYAEKFVRE